MAKLLTKQKPSHPLNGMHTAGLFADMSLDGPVIGTLVAIVDRGKNLPNRKTIGKQDPYCHVRLGKEAKKTATDIRGGQTPRWDQELRFTVHESPDYLQLKVSVFTDDKKTDLIGETWIDLRDIVIPGGGQSDKWHGLTCRSKYAGEVRMEITYYDTRPKPEKSAPKPAPAPATAQREEIQRLPPKRRPLPSDPVTGQAPMPPAPRHTSQTPPKPLPGHQPSFIPTQSPLQAVEYQTAPLAARTQGYSTIQAVQAPQTTPPLGSQNPPPLQSTAGFAHHPSQPPLPAAELPVIPQRALPEQLPPQNRQVELPGAYGNGYEDVGQQSLGYQGHGTPPQQLQHYARQDPRYDPRYDGHPDPYSSLGPREVSPAGEPMQFPPDDERPPPPPAHGTRHRNSQEFAYRNSYDASSLKGTPPTMRQDVLRNEAHRTSFNSSTAYPGRPQYKAHDSAPPAVPQHGRSDSRDEYHPSPPRHHSYDASFEGHQRSMQPTVEDMPDSPPSIQQQQQMYRQNDGRALPSSADQYGKVPSPAPLNLGGRGSVGSELPTQRSPSAVQYGASCEQDYGHSPSPAYDSRRASSGPSPRQPFDSGDGGQYMSRHEVGRDDLAVVPHRSSQTYRQSEIPASLVPGMDPYLAQDITDRIYEDRRPARRYTQQDMGTPTRGRQQAMETRVRVDTTGGIGQRSPNFEQGRAEPRGSMDYQSPGMDHRGSYGPPSSSRYDEPYTPPDWRDDGRALTYAGTNYSASHSGYDQAPPSAGRGISPGGQHTIRRKSVSPVPPPADTRRHSGVPFGPDSYDEFNPTLAQARAENPECEDPDTKIITHDGREVDPSDHLPMSSWAPEPDKTPKDQSPDTRSRPSPAGAQPMPQSGRRQIRVQARPQSMVTPSQSYTDASPSPAAANPGRNRLQKRSTHRMPALPSSSSSGPLVPIDNTPGGSGFTPPRQVSRASTFDYNGSENREPMYGSSPGNRNDFRSSYSARDDGYDRGFRASATGPPIPGKIPLQLTMSGANGRSHDDELALMHEMQNIDLGSGRSRRHRGY